MIYLRSLKQNTSYNPIGAFFLPLYVSFDKEDKKRFKYTGVVVNDPVVHKNIDTTYSFEAGEESMIPFRLSHGKPSTEVFVNKGDLENWEEYAELIAKKGIKTIASGYVEAKPTDKVCGTCDFQDICKYKNTNTRKFSKPKIDDFANIINGRKGGNNND